MGGTLIKAAGANVQVGVGGRRTILSSDSQSRGKEDESVQSWYFHVHSSRIMFFYVSSLPYKVVWHSRSFANEIFGGVLSQSTCSDREIIRENLEPRPTSRPTASIWVSSRTCHPVPYIISRSRCSGLINLLGEFHCSTALVTVLVPSWCNAELSSK